MAPKSPATGNKKGAAPKQKMPAKKAKTEEEEVPELPEEEDDVDVADLDEEEEGDVEAAVAAEGPAKRTRNKTGGAPTAAAKKTAMAAATNALPQPTLVDILLGDHRDTVALLKHFEQVSKSDDKLMLEKLTDAIALTIRLHSQAEFEVLYPVMEKKLGSKGKELSKVALEDHSKIEEDLLKALELRKEGNKELAGTIQEVMDLFIKHLADEEDEMVPLLLAKMTEEEQVELAASFMEAKAKAPLNPQPIDT